MKRLAPRAILRAEIKGEADADIQRNRKNIRENPGEKGRKRYENKPLTAGKQRIEMTKTYR